MTAVPAAATDWVRHGAGDDGLERLEAFFHGEAYTPHRHDTYAIGSTLAGVQSFTYRASLRHSLAGHTVVLHPDEVHDGHAGTDEGFRYRMLYLSPARLQQMLGGVALPFVPGGVSTDPRLARATRTLLARLASPLEALEQDDGLLELATALQLASGVSPRPLRGDYRAACVARDYLHARLDGAVTLDDLAAAAGRDRWSVSRDFRASFGTSPYRYLTLRRLDLARRLMLAGQPLADCAVQAGFSDQSHLTRQFAKAFGVTPARWLRMTGLPARQH
ncbi:AraC family transcriptional regulator [Mitsuaria sp. GD03876]|uniref:AraC family transcriptional regulator n=1 Tax=Mitsuaria sp. GD03876 TaxID=2975399 RepID=UPI00244C25E1|nr:AraC family transcriptional regulator [Mitsuaria sp. GD03876]MDH0866809.1 AraC family transcriptional regulator [Mitsuaria sp. GD03876]